MTQFQKNVLFLALVAGGLGLGAFGINYCVQEHAQHIEQQRVEWRKENISALKDLSGIGALSTEEQTRVDNAGDDYDRLQQVLLDIHQERINFWQGRISDGVGDMNEARANLSGFQSAKRLIRSWKGISFEAFEARQSLHTVSTNASEVIAPAIEAEHASAPMEAPVGAPSPVPVDLVFRGDVFNADTMLPVAGANVSVGEVLTNSDDSGAFHVELSADSTSGRYNLIATKEGFELCKETVIPGLTRVLMRPRV